MNRAVFLDRDGTLIRDVNYIGRVDQVELLPGVREGLVRLRAEGYRLVVVTNQSGVARGFFDEEAVAAVHQRLDELLDPQGGIERYLVCPHLEGGPVPEYAIECDCRKPKPGLIRRAAAEMKLDLPASFLIGDSTRDIEAAHAAGVRSVLVLTGTSGAAGAAPSADHVAQDLPAAALWIVQQEGLGQIV